MATSWTSCPWTAPYPSPTVLPHPYTYLQTLTRTYPSRQIKLYHSLPIPQFLYLPTKQYHYPRIHHPRGMFHSVLFKQGKCNFSTQIILRPKISLSLWFFLLKYCLLSVVLCCCRTTENKPSTIPSNTESPQVSSEGASSPAKLTAGGTVSFSLTAKKQKSTSALPKTSVFDKESDKTHSKGKVSYNSKILRVR